MGSFYRSKHELVFVYKVGTAPHLNTVELGKHGRYRTNVWDYAGVNTFRSGRDAELEMHPTVKPTALVIDAIKDCSRRGDIVLDAFLARARRSWRRTSLVARRARLNWTRCTSTWPFVVGNPTRAKWQPWRSPGKDLRKSSSVGAILCSSRCGRRPVDAVSLNLAEK